MHDVYELHHHTTTTVAFAACQRHQDDKFPPDMANYPLKNRSVYLLPLEQ